MPRQLGECCGTSRGSLCWCPVCRRKHELTTCDRLGSKDAKAGSRTSRMETAMKKILILATFASVIGLPAFAQSFDPDVGTGNIAPPVASMGPPSAYAQAPAFYEREQAPAFYEREYVRHRRAHRSGMPRAIDRDNTSVPGQGVDKDDTIPQAR